MEIDEEEIRKMKLQPMPGLVIIEPLKKKEKTKSGILLPKKVQDKPTTGKVLAVGEALTDINGDSIPVPCRVGNKVIYKKWETNRVEYDGITYLISKFEDILATVPRYLIVT